MSRLAIPTLLLIVAALPGWLSAQVSDPAATVSTSDAAVSSSSEWYRGLTNPSKQVTLKAPLDGLLAEVLVEEGQRVKQGDLLARMDDDIQQLSVDATQIEADDTTEIHHAELMLEEAEYELQQTMGLFDKQAATDLEVRRAKLRRDQAKANLAVAHKNKELSKMRLKREIERLRHYRIEAPFDGQVIFISTETEPGATLPHDTPLLVLAKLDPLESQLYLPVELYGQLKVGQVYELQADVPVNRVVKGKLTYCEPRIDLASHTFRCVFEIQNPDSELPSGFMVQLLRRGD